MLLCKRIASPHSESRALWYDILKRLSSHHGTNAKSHPPRPSVRQFRTQQGVLVTVGFPTAKELADKSFANTQPLRLPTVKVKSEAFAKRQRLLESGFSATLLRRGSVLRATKAAVLATQGVIRNYQCVQDDEYCRFSDGVTLTDTAVTIRLPVDPIAANPFLNIAHHHLNEMGKYRPEHLATAECEKMSPVSLNQDMEGNIVISLPREGVCLQECEPGANSRGVLDSVTQKKLSHFTTNTSLGNYLDDFADRLKGERTKF